MFIHQNRSNQMLYLMSVHNWYMLREAKRLEFWESELSPLGKINFETRGPEGPEALTWSS